MALVDNKIDYMILQRRQIVKALINQVNVKDPLCTKYASTSFQFIAVILTSVIVTINRTVPIQRLSKTFLDHGYIEQQQKHP
jgi:hypothetical protein